MRSRTRGATLLNSDFAHLIVGAIGLTQKLGLPQTFATEKRTHVCQNNVGHD